MPQFWKTRIQHLIDLAHDRIQQLESGGTFSADMGAPAMDSTRQMIEVERGMIARLQETIDRLTLAH